MTLRGRHRRGVALVAALSLMTLLGLMIVGALAATTIAERSARAALVEGPLGTVAERATRAILDDPTAFQLADLEVGLPTTFSLRLADAPGVTASASATRLAGGLVWIVGEAWLAADTTARRRVGRLARFPMADRVPSAPIVAGGAVTLAADVSVGRDTLAAGDCAESAAADSVITDDSTRLYQASWQRTVLDSSTATRVRGDTTLAGGAFRGVLVVDGDLSVTGTFTLEGLAIVRGRVVAHQGLVLTGALVAAGSVDLAGASIRFSPCLIGQVVRRAVRLRTVSGRGWVDVF